MRRGASTVTIKGAAAASSLLSTAVIIRLYGLELFGVFSFALLTVRLLGTFSSFGLESLLLVNLLKRAGRQHTALSLVSAACIGYAHIISGAITILTLVVSSMFYILGYSTFFKSIIILLPIILLQTTTGLQASILRSRRCDFSAQLVLLGLPSLVPASILIVLSFIFNQQPEFLPEFSFVAGSVIGCLVGFLLTGVHPGSNGSFAFTSILKAKFQILRRSAAIHLANIANYSADFYVTIFVSWFGSFEMVGALRVFRQIGSSFQMLSNAIEIPFSTELAHANFTQNRMKVFRLLRLSQLIIGSIGFGTLAIIGLFYGELFAFLDVNQTGLVGPLFCYLLFVALSMTSGAASGALVILNCPKELARSSALSLLASALITTVSIPFLGLYGASLALGAATLTRATLNYLSVRRVTN
ncbi:hypothetical protein N8940_02175 [Sphingomonadaceae bacterium]|nr:hypothetical protein [Sphingomonadaceae bacterium]